MMATKQDVEKWLSQLHKVRMNNTRNNLSIEKREKAWKNKDSEVLVYYSKKPSKVISRYKLT